MNTLIRKIISKFPKKLQEFYYKYEKGLLYIFYGGLTTLVSLGTQYLCFYVGLNTAVQTTVSWICAVTFAYITNKLWVFDSRSTEKKTLLREILQWYGARLVSYFLELGFLILTVDILECNLILMKIIGQVFVMAINYAFSKFVIFKNNKKTQNGNNLNKI
ncbi:MAG: GtrA family protein [Ruminococcus sp.]|jgi:putative flippase GtrA|nr:GtrA family protein [Ruminococcus sp.]